MDSATQYTKKINRLPYWAYSITELIQMRKDTVKIVDGERYELDPEAEKEARVNHAMSRLGII